MKNKTKISIALLVSGAMTTFAAGESVSKPIAEYVTAKDTNHRLEHVADLDFAPMPQPTEHEHCVFVDKSATFQTVLGIGGALTDASAETFYKLPKAKQRELIRAYFDPKEGIGYSLGRTHINSCDFS